MGMVTEVSPLQPYNANRPIEVTELGIVSAPVRPMQPLNAPWPIKVVELGIMIEVKPPQFSNA